ncbi:DUF2537 domain-containing protein [Actinokineospora sp. UTMC 2448]|uniref:DUF2537 domain-containing protein n=1 Tax=Actinokineospora sp. UTMC 2448 TaxID=2268449 RepID=UPI0021648BF0|nr:DUF2537 domain-containing protein [Actinokineospora sp. UTMC 2448]UVS76814.1 hypothetical protein Actkin_00509 [Actinokineospora sp. UTMC 2448]
MELRARDERAVLVGDDREIDPDTLPLGADLTADLRDWARVAGAVGRTEAESAAAVVSRRGRQLAARVAEAMNTQVSYVDPLSGEVAVLAPPVTQEKQPPPPEPTPWATGLLVAAFAFTLVVFAVGTLSATLDETSPLLAVGANVVVTAGLLPSVWLTRGVPIWRWVALGVAGGIGAGWVALPFIVFG